ncbi:MAG TPA: cytidine deaminase [Candidatus Atribacteria bacterium]|nr:cytidine deaminase [Candidatus Atribacteria bacterium]HPT78853.1 cytidine deaminase [Candidatus Atribacteria bacterium]
MDHKALAEAAVKARQNAYVPYSRLRVGAALLTESGKVYTGVNVENVSFGATGCAERTAIFSAVADGNTKFKAIAVASDLDTPIFPCGICRQVIAEFRIPEIIVSDKNGNYKVYKLEELLPFAFTEF